MERFTYQDIPKGMFEKLIEFESFIKESHLETAKSASGVIDK